MAPRISLALVLHNHQPVGNFGWVIEDVFRRSYEPMLGALERHPAVRIALHYSGPLLEWIEQERPDAIERIAALVARGQVEILGGGYYEPVLASLPERDRRGQLLRMADELERRFGQRPVGAWLAERVWEPTIAADLSRAGYRYTVLDDNHLRAATVPEAEMWGTYTTDDQGRLLTLFASEQGLRYRIPWDGVDAVIAYLRAHATDDGRRVGMMGDDGEKFGAWPRTYDYCWGEEAWVDRFFGALEENAEWLATVQPGEWLRSSPSLGRIYVPTTSYVEMSEWALPPAESRVFHALLHEARERRSPELRFLQGGFWRNFQARYREVNDLHKQMLRVSEKVDAMGDGAARQRALDHLYRGQSNDCYWHGLFGGIYIVHMRMATLAHLIAAEDLADAAAEGDGAGGGWSDADLDGRDELILASPGQVLLVDPTDGGAIGGWDLRASRVALASVLRRRPEVYHEQVIEQDRVAVAAPTSTADPAGPVNPHAAQTGKEQGLAALLLYDDHERRSGLVRLFEPAPGDGDHDVSALAAEGGARELGDFTSGEYAPLAFGERSVVLRRESSFVLGDGRPSLIAVEKRIESGGDRLDPSLDLDVVVTDTGGAGLDAELVLEWNLDLLGGGHNPAARYVVDGVETPHDVVGSAGQRDRVSFGNRHEGVWIEATAEGGRFDWFPVETVSNSEAGFERVYQGSCLLARWRVRLEPGASTSVHIGFRVTQTRDRRAEEEAPLAASRGGDVGRADPRGAA